MFKKLVSHPVYQNVIAAAFRNTVTMSRNKALFLSDHIGQMQNENFPDFKIAKSYYCVSTKIACISNYALANELMDDMKK